MNVSIELIIIFAVLIAGFLVIDLAFFNKRAHRVSTRSAVIQSLFWVLVSLVFAGLIYYQMGSAPAAEFLSAYVTEKMLSIDNLFVIMLIFSYFQLEEKFHHRVLFYGILGAIVLRGIFIGAGALIIEQFHWPLYIFGAILLYTGFKLFANKKEETIDFESNRVLVLAKRYLPFTTNDHRGAFMTRVDGKRCFTMLFMIVLLVETTDLIFAFDSIPAAFAISRSPFIIFTANIFAVMGLRALFFLVENVLQKFHFLQKGLSFILIFIGVKMLAGIVDIHVSSLTSLVVILVTIGLALLASLVFPQKKPLLAAAKQ